MQLGYYRKAEVGATSRGGVSPAGCGARRLCQELQEQETLINLHRCAQGAAPWVTTAPAAAPAAIPAAQSLWCTGCQALEKKQLLEFTHKTKMAKSIKAGFFKETRLVLTPSVSGQALTDAVLL